MNNRSLLLALCLVLAILGLVPSGDCHNQQQVSASLQQTLLRAGLKGQMQEPEQPVVQHATPRSATNNFYASAGNINTWHNNNNLAARQWASPAPAGLVWRQATSRNSWQPAWPSSQSRSAGWSSVSPSWPSGARSWSTSASVSSSSPGVSGASQSWPISGRSSWPTSNNWSNNNWLSARSMSGSWSLPSGALTTTTTTTSTTNNNNNNWSGNEASPMSSTTLNPHLEANPTTLAPTQPLPSSAGLWGSGASLNTASAPLTSASAPSEPSARSEHNNWTPSVGSSPSAWGSSLTSPSTSLPLDGGELATTRVA